MGSLEGEAKCDLADEWMEVWSGVGVAVKKKTQQLTADNHHHQYNIDGVLEPENNSSLLKSL